MKLPLTILSWSGSVWRKVLSSILILAIVGALGTLIYSVANPLEEPFTEFYLLGLSGEATDYPSLLMVGEEGKVKVGILNREYETVTYRMVVRIGGVISNEEGPVTLEHNEKWEEVVDFIPDRAGNEQQVEFLLYKQGQSEIYRSLHLWVDVQ